ncbi:MAG TPA: type II secretion system protein [Microvirga sp.]|jgi:general secretion pathway protein I|nr:type II secretion system protein [Microvirga sp.]
MHTADRNRAGFTLLEALVALAILTGTTASLMVLIATNGRAQAQADADVSAALHARTLLARIGRDLPLAEGGQSGALDSGDRWSVLITPFAIERGAATVARPGLFQVVIRLERRASGSLPVEVVSLKRAPR